MRLMRLSASQVQTFLDCQRKWAWRYIAGIEEPPSASAELGRAVHAELEKYLRGGEIDFTTEVGYIAASGLQHLPKPGAEGMQIEAEFHFEGPSGHSYLGYKDLEMPRVVYDHKSTGDLKWQKTEEDLKTDIQATLYAADYFRNNPDELEVELRWVYYQTRGTKKSAVTRVTRHQGEVWDRFLEIERVAEQMASIDTKDPLELPPSINHCSAFGGCPHQGRCNLSPFDKMRSYMEQNKLLASLQAKKNGAAAPASAAPDLPAAASAPATPAPSPPAPAPANRLLARLQANGAPTAAAISGAAINPPEFQPPPAPLPVPAVVPVMPAPAVTADASVAPAAAAAAAPADAPRGRGRPKKAAVPATGLATKIEVLYLNCGPVGVAVADATDFIVLAKKRVASEGLADYRFAEYGAGPGMLAVAAAAELDAMEGVLPALRLDTNTPEGEIIAVEYMARAGLVVR
jgi:CRISPR/Cas system-associated exonuclease Cas4 (RecB family)